MSELRKARPPAAAPARRQHQTNPSEWLKRRWMQLKRFTEHQIESLHERERRAYQQFAVESEAFKAGGPRTQTDWRTIGQALISETNSIINEPFFPPRSIKEWREAEMQKFERHTFALWRSIWNRFDAAWDKKSGEPGYMSELDAVHQCDLAIWRDRYPFPPKSVALAGGGMEHLKVAAKPISQDEWWDK